MMRSDYISECYALINSFDERVEADDVAWELRRLADQVEKEGLQ